MWEYFCFYFPLLFLTLRRIADILNGIACASHTSLRRSLFVTPQLSALLSRPRALWGYGFGQAFTTWFRLTGPFATESAWDICCGELFQTTLGRGLPANLNFVVMNIVLGAMNAACWAVDRTLMMPLYALLNRTHPARLAPYH